MPLEQYGFKVVLTGTAKKNLRKLSEKDVAYVF